MEGQTGLVCGHGCAGAIRLLREAGELMLTEQGARLICPAMTTLVAAIRLRRRATEARA